MQLALIWKRWAVPQSSGGCCCQILFFGYVCAVLCSNAACYMQYSNGQYAPGMGFVDEGWHVSSAGFTWHLYHSCGLQYAIQ
jgi:hypothetical protein